jgi:hypothetical protein
MEKWKILRPRTPKRGTDPHRNNQHQHGSGTPIPTLMTTALRRGMCDGSMAASDHTARHAMQASCFSLIPPLNSICMREISDLRAPAVLQPPSLDLITELRLITQLLVRKTITRSLSGLYNVPHSQMELSRPREVDSQYVRTKSYIPVLPKKRCGLHFAEIPCQNLSRFQSWQGCSLTKNVIPHSTDIDIVSKHDKAMDLELELHFPKFRILVVA